MWLFLQCCKTQAPPSFLPDPLGKNIVCALVIACLHYSNLFLWSHLSLPSSIVPLKSSSSLSSHTPTQIPVNWLPVHSQFQHQLLELAFKSLYDFALHATVCSCPITFASPTPFSCTKVTCFSINSVFLAAHCFRNSLLDHLHYIFSLTHPFRSLWHYFLIQP